MLSAWAICAGAGAVPPHISGHARAAVAGAADAAARAARQAVHARRARSPARLLL